MVGRKVYVDASVVLRKLLNQPGAIERWSDWALAVSSELMQVEALRTLDRLRVAGRLSEQEVVDALRQLREYTAGFEVVPLTREVLRRAGAPLSTPLGTLDAIHLATALLWTEHYAQELLLVTHDGQLGTAALACGMDVQPLP